MLDDANIPSGLLRKNLKELDILNRIAGGHSISLKGIKQLITNHSRIYHLVDLGCGSGDTLKYIAVWARKNNFKVQLTGIDVNEDAIEYLKIHCSDYPEITGIAADYLDYLGENQEIDIVHCSLFCHHLNDEELIDLFVYFKQKLKCGFVINDLHRYWLAYCMAWLFPRVLNGTKLAKNDGPISVLRGFKKREMQKLLTQANIQNYSMQKAWAFRFLIVGKT